MDRSQNSYYKDGNAIKESVWYEGTDALKRGEGVCYDSDYVGDGATEADGRRCSYVERATSSNNMDFAGTADSTYPASSVPQLITINVPGSKFVPVAIGVDTVLDTGLLTFCVNGKYSKGAAGGDGSEGGRFYTGKNKGRGSAVPRQTVTAVLEAFMDGTGSLDTTGLVLTVADAGDTAEDDIVVLLGGEDEGTSKTVIPGNYTVSSVSGNDITLTSSAVAATPGAALTCTGYVYTGNPVAMCDLLDGEESGGIEFINLPNAGGDTQPYMVGGLSYVCGGLTLANDAECELAQGSLPGDKKTFICLGAMATSDVVVDLVSAGLQLDGSTALAEINAIAAAGDACYLQFQGVKWHTQDIAGDAAEA